MSTAFNTSFSQVWQLVELQNKALLAAPENLEGLDNTNLCFMVAQLSSLAQHDKLSHANELLAEDEGIGGSAQESEGMDSDDKEEDEQEMDNNESGLNNNEESDEDMSENDDDEIFKKPESFKDSGLNDVFADDSDDEEDNFDEFISKEGMESDDSEEEGNKKGHGGNANIIQKNETKQGKVNEGQKFAKSKVDTKFFNLRESEWVADHDAIGDNYSGDGCDDVDLMADMSDGNEGEVRHDTGVCQHILKDHPAGVSVLMFWHTSFISFLPFLLNILCCETECYAV